MKTERETETPVAAQSGTDGLGSVESELRAAVKEQEASHSRADRPADSLWDHLVRVAALAERLGRAEGVDPVACRLAGLFHDAGKFASGRYHADDRPEEEHSVQMLRELTQGSGLSPDLVDEACNAILQIYRGDPEPDDLARVLFDADNLDKLGALGVANLFVKAGLRGGGVSARFLYRLTPELTYARHAPSCLLTATGRSLAKERAPETVGFILHLLDSLRADGLYDFSVDEVVFDGLVLDVVAPASCECGGELHRRVWDVPGVKCEEIHVEHSCSACQGRSEIRFCRPRLTER